MRARTALAASLTAVVAAGALSPAVAAPKAKPKPVTKSYTATAPTPDPSHAGVTTGICNTTLPSARSSEPFTAPFAGVITIDMSGFQGDWDLAVYQGGRVLADSAQDTAEPVDRPESITLRLRKAGTKIEIRSCNFAGGPTANVTYTHRPS